MRSLFTALALCAAFLTMAQSQIKPYRPYRYTAGIAGTINLAGVQFESIVYKRIGLRVAGAWQFGHERKGEYGLAFPAFITWYFPLKSRYLEPVVGIGTLYSLYHWDYLGGSGNITDWNVAGGAGINIRFSNRFRTRFNLLVANGFQADYDGTTMIKSGRRVLIVPVLSLDFMF